MRTIFKNIVYLVVAVCFIFPVACNGNIGRVDSSPGVVPNEQSKPTLILGATALEMYIEDEYTLRYAVKNIEETATFSSSDVTVATVDSLGVIKAIGSGTAMIVVKVGTLTKSCSVTVKATPIYRIVCQANQITLLADRTFDLNTKFQKGQVTLDMDFTYDSGDSNVLEVSSDGIIKAKTPGTTTVTVSCEYENVYYVETVSVQVNESVWIDCVRSMHFYAVDEVGIVDYVIRDCDDQVVENAVATLSSDNEEIVSIGSGNALILEDCGRATVTVSYLTIQTEVEITVDLGLFADEYNAFYKKEAIQDSYSWNYFNNGVVAWKTAPISLTNIAIGDKFLNDNKVCMTSKAATSETSLSYIGLYVPCRQNKESLQRLSVMYGYLELNIYLDAPQLLGEGNSNIIVFEMFNGYNEYIRANKNQQWLTYRIPMSDVVANCDDLNAKNIPLIKFSSDSRDVYNVYVAPLFFVQ